MRIKVRARKTHKGTFQQDAGDTVGHHRHRLSVISSASNVEIGVIIIINVVCVCARCFFAFCLTLIVSITKSAQVKAM